MRETHTGQREKSNAGMSAGERRQTEQSRCVVTRFGFADVGNDGASLSENGRQIYQFVIGDGAMRRLWYNGA